MFLQVVLGRERGRVYTLEGGSHIVGRGSQSDVVLVSEVVSRSHARITVNGDRASVTDLGSKSGTYVNGARVLGDGAFSTKDVILVGVVALHAHLQPPPELPPEALPGRNGSLVAVPPGTLLRYLAVLRRSCLVALTSPPLQGTIAVTHGHIREVLVGGRKTRDPIQALTAILRWRGTFDLDRADDVGGALLLGLDSVLPAVGSASRAAAGSARR